MPEHQLYLVAGLGNPGPEYARTRHNVGFMVIDALAEKFKVAVDKTKFGNYYGRGRIQQTGIILAKPQEFMNRSGPPLRHLCDYFRIQREAMVIVHDDIDLAYERLKIKEKGGDGGHKGIRSVIEAFGGNEFVRLRLGVGRSVHNANVVDHVLSEFSPDERGRLDDFLQRACEAIISIFCDNVNKAMNRFNQNLSQH